MARIEKLMPKVPVVTIGIALASLIVFGNPWLSDQALYDRLAIQQGQLWRLLTAPLAHLSTSHLVWNLLLFLLFGAMLETCRRRSMILISVLTALTTGIIYLLFVPNLTYYGGLSGLLTGLVAYLALIRIDQRENSRSLWIVVLVLLLAKIGVESVINQPLFVATAGTNFHVLPSSHLIGLSVAVVLRSCEGRLRFTRDSLGASLRRLRMVLSAR
ncbi:MAG: rhombosortase [Desulfuromonadales bacterium]